MRIRKYCTLIIILVFLGTFLIAPLCAPFSRAINSEGDLFLYYKLIANNYTLIDCLVNSLNLALFSTILAASVALPLAILLERTEFKGRNIVGILALTPIILPPFVGAIGLRKIFARFGPLNIFLLKFGIISTPIDWLDSGDFFAVALTEALHLYPIILLNLQSNLNQVNRSLEEAATSFGASSWLSFWRVTLPLLKPGLYAGSSIAFIWAFTDLGTPLVFDYRNVIPVQIFNQIGEIQNNQSGYALISIVMLITITLFMISKLLVGNLNLLQSTKGDSHKIQRVNLSKLQTLLAYSFLFIALGLSIIPHIGVILVAFSDNWFLSFLPNRLTTRAFEELPYHPLVQIGVKNSLFLSLCSTTLDIILGFSIAWMTVRSKIAPRILEILTITPLAVPGIILAYGYLGLFANSVIDPRINPIPLLIIGYAIRRLPFMVRSIQSGLLTSNVSLEEAASNFGANHNQVIRFITLPLVAPHIIAGAIMCFTFAVLEVSESLILASQENYFPLTKVMYSLLGRPDGPLISSSLGVVTMLLITASITITYYLRNKFSHLRHSRRELL